MIQGNSIKLPKNSIANVIIWQFEHMHASSETPATMILIVNHENISKLNNENFFKFGYIMGSRVFLKYIQ